jgi:hypothetical protein
VADDIEWWLGSGSARQPLTGSLLMRRYVNFPPRPTSAKDETRHYEQSLFEAIEPGRAARLA